MNLNIEEVILNMPPSTTSPIVPNWFPIAGVVFTAITLLFLMYLIIGPNLDPSKKVIFDALIAFGGAGSFTFFGGTAVASGQIPFFKNAPMRFATSGGIAVFVILLAVLYYINK